MQWRALRCQHAMYYFSTANAILRTQATELRCDTWQGGPNSVRDTKLTTTPNRRDTNVPKPRRQGGFTYSVNFPELSLERSFEFMHN